ncbi:baseplate J/gp47 family protein [Photobacterium sp.]|uniref:baseplate J/gp47 family protein n=1 Tax=Photobacterium sp. TaxID=660 RepID=UPI00299D0FDD|nr:baseplate J/gp47 family protein [Photobacterium sp.]MDX1300893.1 baseplate J/gp47 family protein [Photobacterium sp.]
MTDIPKPDFTELAKKAGLPLEESEWKAVLKEEAEKQGSTIANDSKYSPFWRLIEAMVIKPTVWLINTFLVGYVLPNMFVATAKDKWLDLWAWQFNVTRKPATKAVGQVVINRAATQGPAIVISAGTFVQTDPINGTVYRVVLREDTTLPENELSVVAEVEAEHEGAAYNLGEGYYHILATAMPGISRVVNSADWLVEAGADKESDDQLRVRIRNQFSGVAKWHIDAAYRALLMLRAGINSENVYFEHNAPRGAGSANAYILLDSGEPSSQMLTDLNNHVNRDGNHGHGDDLGVFAMPGNQINVTCRAWIGRMMSSTEKQELETNIGLFIGSAFRQNTDYKATKTKPSSRFSFSKLTQELHAKFTELESIEFDNSDIANGMEVPRISNMEVSVATA